MTRCALAMCENIDWNVGRVLAQARRAEAGRQHHRASTSATTGPNSWRWNGGMKGRKGSTDEGGVRAPFLIRWPATSGRARAFRRSPARSTCCPRWPTWPASRASATKPLDGGASSRCCWARPSDWPDRMIFSLRNKRISVRTQQYRLDPQGALFDMVADPGQDRDIAAEKPEVAARLREGGGRVGQGGAAAGRRRTTGRSRSATPRPPLLPARDGVAEGGVRAQRQGAQLLLLHPLDEQGRPITWDIEVGQARRLRGRRLLHLPDGGCRLDGRIELPRQRRCEAKVAEANDPPLVGKAVRPRAARAANPT